MYKKGEKSLCNMSKVNLWIKKKSGTARQIDRVTESERGWLREKAFGKGKNSKFLSTFKCIFYRKYTPCPAQKAQKLLI